MKVNGNASCVDTTMEIEYGNKNFIFKDKAAISCIYKDENT